MQFRNGNMPQIETEVEKKVQVDFYVNAIFANFDTSGSLKMFNQETIRCSQKASSKRKMQFVLKKCLKLRSELAKFETNSDF